MSGRTRRLTVGVTAIAFAMTLGLAPTAQAATPKPPTKALPSALDVRPPYEPQVSCDPRPKAGVVAFAALMKTQYQTGTMGNYRPCDASISEHYDSRALDWMLSVNIPNEKAIADSVTAWLSADNGAMALRFGINYIIWNHRIWGVYDPTRGDQGWAAYTGSVPHTDHVHLSFSWDGAMKRTSWWTGTATTVADLGPCRVYAGQFAPLYTRIRNDACPNSLLAAPVSPYAVAVYGQANEQIKVAQRLLGVVADGSFGSITFDALVSWQARVGVPVTGALDKASWAGLAPPPNQAPIGVLDFVTSDTTSLSVRGWALDPDTTSPIRVHVYVDGVATASIAADTSRPDVGRIFGKGDNHGFVSTFDAAAGPHEVCVYAINTPAGPNPGFGCKSVVVYNKAPIGALDFVTSGMESFTVRGWALDPDTTSPIRAHVYVDGVATASIPADTSRPDVGRIFAMGDDHGFTDTFKATYGPHEVCVYAIDSSGGSNRQVGCATVDVNGTAIGVLDFVTSTSPGLVGVRGWALDPNTTSSIRVHLYVDGVGAASIAANTSRPDVGRIFGMGDNHGFLSTVKAARGSRLVCAYAIDSAGGTNPRIGCKNVTVP
ncbi:MAG: peptidoglycan-binding domain-containing protein [Actinomycetota bacterium]